MAVKLRDEKRQRDEEEAFLQKIRNAELELENVTSSCATPRDMQRLSTAIDISLDKGVSNSSEAVKSARAEITKFHDIAVTRAKEMARRLKIERNTQMLDYIISLTRKYEDIPNLERGICTALKAEVPKDSASVKRAKDLISSLTHEHNLMGPVP